MTRPTDPNRFPTSFPLALDRALALGEFRIPCERPASLRQHFYGYFQALRKAGQKERADAVLLTTEPGVLILRARDTTSEAQAVEAALKAAEGDSSPSQGLEAFDQLQPRRS